MLIIKRPTVVTVNVLYYRPDFPSLVQDFIWQCEDVVPELRRIHQFLGFWRENIEARINRIMVTHGGDPEWRNLDDYQKM